MKRYMLFIFDAYYELGGMRDLYGYFDNYEEIIEVINEHEKPMDKTFQIYDNELQKIIYEKIVSDDFKLYDILEHKDDMVNYQNSIKLFKNVKEL